ncbi:hypothetical protein PhCBS80983_g00575 [Powellomyces hirtus]|uniref:Dynein axonemal assembly factor 4 n=1 Tax=Powellomyces hirtus TaxID=109895 RepID=A0A507EEH8_9FUNG|nr:hypothetical protein PhCBS80983_g00575 [Powellomyces hirtus]
MPILIKEYTWAESSSHLYITVPLKGANPKKADVYVNDLYAKINFPPYFFELDLKAPVHSSAAIATIGNGCAKLELPKQEHEVWTSVAYIADSPEALKARREEADARFRQRAEDARQAKVRDRSAEEQLLVQKQIEVEQAERAHVAQLKEAEKQKAEADVQSWVKEANQQNRKQNDAVRGDHQKNIKLPEIFDVDEGYISDTHTKEPGAKPISIPKSNVPNAAEANEANSDDEEGLDMESIRAKVRSQLAPRTIPPPRASNAEITIKFTSRGLIPTKTARESEDAKWHTRIKAMQDDHVRKTNPTADDDRTFEETNPMFLKDKGNGFYKAGNYEAAVNAYTAALESDPANLPCLSNRAACHLQLNAHDQCIADCEAALALLSKEEEMIVEQMIEDNAVEMRRKARVKLLVRMGTASVRSNDKKAGLDAYRRASSLDPRNDTLRKDVTVLEQSARCST